MIDVIIPVYRGLAATRRCLESVLGCRVDVPHEVIVIDDASPEPDISAWLKQLSEAGRITLVTHASNAGFVASANEGMGMHTDRDVVLLNSDTEVADGWLDRLVACAARDPRTGTVTPFSNNATICSYPNMEPPHALPDGLGVEDLDRLFAEENAGLSIEIPTGVGFCMLIRRACIAETGEFDEAAFGAGYGEEVDFCLRASKAGWRHRLAADVFVFHEGAVSFGADRLTRQGKAQAIVDARYPEFTLRVRNFALRDPAAPARERVASRIASLPIAPDDSPNAMQGIAAPVLCVFTADGQSDCHAENTLAEAARQALMPPAPARLLTTASLGEGLREVLAAYPGRDIVLVAAGVRLPKGWDARLLKALHADPTIGGVSPLVMGDPYLSPLDANASATDLEALDAAAFNAGDRRFYELPTLSPACAAVKADWVSSALEGASRATDAGAFMANLAHMARQAGRGCVALDHLVVSGAIPAHARIADPVEANAFLLHSPFGQLRRSLGDAASRGMPRPTYPGLDHRPVRLHVTHYWGGGVERWVRDFAKADSGAIHLTFASYRIGDDGGQRFELRTSPTDKVPVRTWDLAQPFRSTGVGSIEYRRLLREVIADFCVDSVVVSSLIGQDLGALATGLPTVVALHDLYPACQAINPSFRGKVCTSCTREDLEACRAENPLNIVFRGAPVDDWLALRAAFVQHLLRYRPALAVPSPWVRQTLLDLEPALASLDIAILGHGIDERPPRLPHPPRVAGERLRLAVVGRLSEVKGTKLLEAAARDLAEYADIWIVGEGQAGKQLAQTCGWHHIPGYTPETLSDVLLQVAPHAALLPSVVPETFSYTLSELLNLGVVPLVTRLGSFAARVQHGDNGFVFEPDPHHLAGLVRVLHDEPNRLPEVASRLASKPPQPTTGAMAEAYRKWIPSQPLMPARYAVGIGAQTGLSEPYRHLTRAYGELQSAYEKTRAALDETRQAYEQAQQALATLQSALDAAEKKAAAAQDSAAKLAESLKDQPLTNVDPLPEEGPPAEPESPPAKEKPRGTTDMDPKRYPWAERLSPERLKSPWWIGHIPFAYELIGRLRPSIVVELGTYSGSSFAAFCQALEAVGQPAKCFGVDLWEGDVHMGRFDEELYQEMRRFSETRYPDIARLIRKDFNQAVSDFADGSIDLLHIDGTHTYEAVSNDFRTWLPKMSPRGVILFHDINVTMENAGPASQHFGVRRLFDEVKGPYPHLEFEHCYGLGMLVTGTNVPPEVLALGGDARQTAFATYFATKGAAVQRQFEESGTPVVLHNPYGETTSEPRPLWRRAASRLRSLLIGSGPAR